MTPLPIDWCQLKKLHYRTLSETSMTTLPGQRFDCLSMNVTRAVQYQGVCGLGDQTHQEVHPFPPIKACPPDPKFSGSLLN